MGDAIVADVGLTLRALVAELDEASRAEPDPLPDPVPGEETDPLTPTMVTTPYRCLPEDGFGAGGTVGTLAATSSGSRPELLFGAGGGLASGRGSIGVQLAQPDRPVVCVLGEGSAQYAIAALWSAVAYEVPVTFLVLQNREYAILKWFAEIEEVKGAPGLDLPAVDTAAVADGYGVSSTRVGEREELREALKSAIGSKKPELIEVPVTPGMALF
jgi:benzoylformate decarboxylase